PRDIPLEKANQLLHRLNSFDSAKQLENVTNKYPETKILSIGDAQRILRTKVELGEFQDLQHVACVRRIGAKKFDAIVRTLSNQVKSARCILNSLLYTVCLIY
ncbi:hypothetical protein KA005_60970, partial [bacterium]|nr:hypothetical protein [bacterium]